MTRPPPPPQWRQVLVDPARLQHGGDINDSYSADRIMEGKPLRKPFPLEGRLWVATGGLYQGRIKVYQLTPAAEFEGLSVSYYEKVGADHGARARADPLGFYHGIQVRLRGQPWVLTGPPAECLAHAAAVQRTPVQLTLFAEEA